MARFKEVFKRLELKYLLSDEQYNEMRKRLNGIAEVDEYGETAILNLYCDTPDYRLIRHSLEKPKYKEKLRLRSYGIPDANTAAFIEIKKKYRGVVYKRRISLPYSEALSYLRGKSEIPAHRRQDFESDQIAGEIDYFKTFYPELKPMMAISYDRIAMAGVKDPELRITFDRNILYRRDHMDLRYGEAGKPVIGEDQHLMELKIAGAIPLELVRIFDDLGIYQTSFSKYGMAYMDMKREELMRTDKVTDINEYKRSLQMALVG